MKILENLQKTIEPWFWEAPAASSGMHHPKTSLGEGGLARHTVALSRILNYMLEVESIAKHFTSRERDLLRVAGMMHDTRKSGTQEDYEKNRHTKFDHPLQAAEVIRGLDGLPKNEIELIAHVIESHMGQFNTHKNYPNIILPKPEDKYQIIVHLADYICSRKDVEVQVGSAPEYKKEKKDTTPPDINTWRFDFGKHNGKTIPEVYEIDRGYIRWAKSNMEKEPARSLLSVFNPE